MIQQTFNPPIWHHLGHIKFRITVFGFGFSVNDEREMHYETGDRITTRLLLEYAKQKLKEQELEERKHKVK